MPNGVFQVSGGRINSWSKGKSIFKWSKEPPLIGIFPNQDNLMYDFNYANWAKNEQKEP